MGDNKNQKNSREVNNPSTTGDAVPILPPTSDPERHRQRRWQGTPIAYDYEMKHITEQDFLANRDLSQQTPLQEYKDYIKLRINYYSKKALRLRRIHNILQTTILVGAALVSISIGFPHIFPWLPPLISGIVTITAVIANYYKFGERSRDLYRGAEDMQQEYNWFKSKRGGYKNISEMEAFELLQDKIDSIKHDQFIRTFAVEEQPTKQK